MDHLSGLVCGGGLLWAVARVVINFSRLVNGGAAGHCAADRVGLERERNDLQASKQADQRWGRKLCTLHFSRRVILMCPRFISCIATFSFL